MKKIEFEIIRAVPEDLEELVHIMETVAAGMEKKEWFVSDDLPYIKAHLRDGITLENGFILKAVTEKEIAGFFMVDFPGSTAHNLGNYLHMTGNQLMQVAHMDSVVILPKYRGHRLQYRLMEEAEQVIRKQTNYRILLATVHPDNIYSLQNAKARGFHVAAEVTAYQGLPRYIIRKDFG